jgi:hypothetical protein
MSRSHDRVRFTIDTFTDEATREAFRQAFGTALLCKSGPIPITTIGVICRPSQFARFLIYRNDFGGRNLFKELKPQLFTPRVMEQELDVSGNPAL